MNSRHEYASHYGSTPYAADRIDLSGFRQFVVKLPLQNSSDVAEPFDLATLLEKAEIFARKFMSCQLNRIVSTKTT